MTMEQQTDLIEIPAGEEDAPAPERRAQRLLPHVCGERVLEFGVLDGAFDALLASEGRQVTVVDDRADALDAAAPNAGPQVRYLRGGLDSAAGDAPFDTVLLHQGDVRDAALPARAAALLAPGGTLAFFAALGDREAAAGGGLLRTLLPGLTLRTLEFLDERWVLVVCANQPDDGTSLDVLEDTLTRFAAHALRSAASEQSKRKDLLRRLQEATDQAKELRRALRRVKRSKAYRLGRGLRHPATLPALLARAVRAGGGRLARAARSGLGRVPGVSVIIPTYRPNPYVEECVQSTLRQTIRPGRVEILLVANGPDTAHWQALRQRYAANRRVKVLYTPKAGLSAARNLGLAHARREYVTFLDDDDRLTPGYLAEALAAATPSVNLVCTRLVDECDGRQDPDTYMNRALKAFGRGGDTTDYERTSPLLSSACAKVYRTTMVRDAFDPFDETAAHTEDVLFWAMNFPRLSGKVHCCSADSRESYLRRVVAGSMSRPTEENPEQLFTFWVTDRLAVIDRLTALLLGEGTLPYKRFLARFLRAQTSHMVRYWEGLDEEGQARVRAVVNASDNPFLNKGRFSPVQAIAFCHNFSPTVDPSAFVAAKRLRQIDELEGQPLRWDVVSADMSNIKTSDPQFDWFYTRSVVNRHLVVRGPARFHEKAQDRFGHRAFEQVRDLTAEVIYSRSQFAGSHVAALLYKLRHPGVKWYAEFSDPVSVDAAGQPRPTPHGDAPGQQHLRDFWREVERNVYRFADVIVFTNEKQREFMLGRNDRPELNGRVLARSLVLRHPVLPPWYGRILPVAYELDPSFLHVGYFGSFYPNRQCADMLKLLANERVMLHFFVTRPEMLDEYRQERVRVNPVVGHLEFLNIAAKMDYLFLNDIDFDGPVNPYLPSKLADYLSAGAPILAKVNEGTVLSQVSAPALWKVTEVTDEVARQLRKAPR